MRGDDRRPAHVDDLLLRRFRRMRDVDQVSPQLFTAMLRIHAHSGNRQNRLSRQARRLLEVLENNSPLSTRDLKRFTDLSGKANEAAYSRAMKELFTQLLIVSFGEVEDGAFPSAAVGATEALFSDLSRDAEDLTLANARQVIDRFLPEGSHFRRFFERTVQFSVGNCSQ